MLRVSLIGIILLFGVLVTSLAVYFRSKRRAKEDARKCRCNSCEGAECPSNVCPVHPEKTRAPQTPPVRPPTGTAEAVAAAVSLARADHVHPRSGLVPPSPMFLYHRSRSVNGVPVDPGTTLDQTMQQFDALMQDLGTNMEENINRMMGNLNRSMGNLTHYYEDFATLHEAGISPEQIIGDTRYECLVRLRGMDVFRGRMLQMFSWRDHDQLPDWPEVMRSLLRNQAGTPRAPQQPAQAQPAEPEKPSEPPLRFERDDVI